MNKATIKTAIKSLNNELVIFIKRSIFSPISSHILLPTFIQLCLTGTSTTFHFMSAFSELNKLFTYTFDMNRNYFMCQRLKCSLSLSDQHGNNTMMHLSASYFVNVFIEGF